MSVVPFQALKRGKKRASLERNEKKSELLKDSWRKKKQKKLTFRSLSLFPKPKKERENSLFLSLETTKASLTMRSINSSSGRLAARRADVPSSSLRQQASKQQPVLRMRRALAERTKIAGASVGVGVVSALGQVRAVVFHSLSFPHFCASRSVRSSSCLPRKVGTKTRARSCR